MENPKLTEILEQFRLDAIEWRATRDGHCWTVRQKAYQSALDTLGVEWLDKTQSYFKSRLDDIESDIKKHNCPCGFSCDDDTYFQVHVIREHQVLELEIPQGAPIDPKFIDVFLRENGYDPQEVGERFERVAREALKKARERMEQTND